MKKLHRYMKKNNMTRTALSRKLKVTEATLSYWLNGQRVPTLKHAIKIERVTGGWISVYDLA